MPAANEQEWSSGKRGGGSARAPRIGRFKEQRVRIQHRRYSEQRLRTACAAWTGKKSAKEAFHNVSSSDASTAIH